MRIALRHPLACALLLLGATTGCANYGAVADLNASNQFLLLSLETQLSVDAFDGEPVKDARALLEPVRPEKLAKLGEKEQKELLAEWKTDVDAARTEWIANLEKEFSDTKEALGAALAKEGRAQAELGRFPGLGRKDRATLLNASRAEIQAEYYEQIDAIAQRAADIAKLELALIMAVRTLRENGEDIQQYLELPWWKRVGADVKGMDREQLKQIGEDLKSLQKKLGPALAGG